MLDTVIVVAIIVTISAVLFVLSRALNKTPSGYSGTSTRSNVDQVPFRRLPALRNVSQPGLPDDLAEFYSQHEGVGLESSPDRLIRLCELVEVKRMTWADLHIFGAEELAGWESFTGYRLGVSSFFDDIVYVVSCPRCSTGSIMTFGLDITGPGGKGPFPFECSLVLANSFPEWLQRLGEMQWAEFGLMPGEVVQMPQPHRGEHYGYYKALNPEIDWS